MVDLLLIIPLVGYLSVLLAVGFFSSRAIKTHEDYYMGGKKIPGWALALSERSTDMSAWLIISVPALSYLYGTSALWVPLGCYIGSMIQWVFYSKRFMEEQEKYGAVTAVDYLAKKHPGGAVGIRVLGAATCFLFYIFYVSAQFAGGGRVMGVFGVSFTVGMVAAAIIIIGYCMAGGFISVVWTDVLQALLMLVTLGIVPIIGLMEIRSRGLSIFLTLSQMGSSMISPFGGKSGMAAGLFLGNSLSWIFGYMGGEPHFFIRHMAIRSERERKSALIIAMVWGAITTFGAWILGVISLTLFSSESAFGVAHSELTEGVAEGILPMTITALVPPVIAGILLAGVIAGMMSTADSQLLVASSAISEDLYHNVIMGGKKVREKHLIWISRLTTLVIGALAFAFVYFQENVVYNLVSYGWAGLAGAFAPSITLSLFWKKFSKAGVYASFISGIVVTVLWISTGFDSAISVRLVSFILPFAAAILASLAFPGGLDEKIESREEKQ